MDYSGGTDPTPFIAGAYGIAASLLAGYTVWLFRLQKNLRELIVAAAEEKERT